MTRGFEIPLDLPLKPEAAANADNKRRRFTAWLTPSRFGLRAPAAKQCRDASGGRLGLTDQH
jgi:hypothetical protein